MSVPAITDYASLQAAVADYLVRDDLSDQIKLAISLAEAKLNRDLQGRRMEARATALTTTNNSYLALPTDFLEIREMALFDGDLRRPLIYQTPVQLDWNYPQQTQGRPQAYSIVDAEFRLAPIPDGQYTIEILYLARMTSLSDSNPTNWVATYHPDLMLWAVLRQVAMFVDDGSLAQQANALYQSEMDSLEAFDKREQFNAAPLIPSPDFPLV